MSEEGKKEVLEKVDQILENALNVQKGLMKNTLLINRLADKGKKIQDKINALDKQLLMVKRHRSCDKADGIDIEDDILIREMQKSLHIKDEPTEQEIEVFEKIINRPNNERYFNDCLEKICTKKEITPKFKPNSTVIKNEKKAKPINTGYDALLKESMTSRYNAGTIQIDIPQSVELQLEQDNKQKELMMERANEKLREKKSLLNNQNLNDIIQFSGEFRDVNSDDEEDNDDDDNDENDKKDNNNDTNK